MDAKDLSVSKAITKEVVRSAVHRLNQQNSAPSKDKIPSWVLNLLANTKMTTEAGMTGTSVLTVNVMRLGQRNPPDKKILLIYSAKLLLIQPRADKFRFREIGMALRRLLTEFPLPVLLNDKRD
eukprot:GFKZ01007197.1.p1 GENE.GFKZ01007197.1~~GFKZ01007197.1.p1  ORF type:complete len:124 (-),score=10.70 GFKZ01007197.1:158-529(-)